MALADDDARQCRFRDWRLVDERLPVAAGQLVIDLGCGIGDRAADFAARGARVVGVDANPELLAAARGRTIPGAAFVEADLRAWSDAGLAAGGLWCSFAAAYFTDFVPVLRRWCAALRPGAWVALVEIDDLFGHEPLPDETRAALTRYADEAAAAGRYDFRMGRKLAGAAAAAGLEVEHEAHLPDGELAFAGPASAEALASWTARLDRMSLLHRHFGGGWDAARREILGCLADPAHRARAKVVFVLARAPGRATG